MRKERMTVEELNSLKPSYENQVKMVCDNGYYVSNFESVSVISPCVKKEFVVIDKNGNIRTIDDRDIVNFPSLKPEKKKWFELWVDNGEGDIQKVQVVCDENFQNRVGRDLFKGCRRSLGREVTDEIEKLEWK